MSLSDIRNAYGVPARLGTKVVYTDTSGVQRTGEIRSFGSMYIKVRFDGDNYLTPLHPKWNLQYLPKQTDMDLAMDPGHEGHVLSMTGYKDGCRRCEILRATELVNAQAQE